MFWNKKAQIIEPKKDSEVVRVTVIPDIFYGGADPLIYHAEALKKSQTAKTVNIPTKDQKTAVVAPPMSKKKITIIISVLSVFVVGGISFYYFWQASVQNVTEPQKLAETKPTPKPEPIVKPTPEPTPEPVIATTTPIVEPAPVGSATSTRPLTFPFVLLKDSVDLDVDSLTDAEEELYKTDSGAWDSDKDGYYDGQEIFNLYNPTGFAPVRLVDSGLVKEYINPTWNYRIYHPIDWAVASVDEKGDHVLFSSITGDYVEVRAMPNVASETFLTWFTNNIVDQKFSDISMFNNRFEVNGYKRQDSLVSYFTGDKVVFVIIYQPAGDAQDIPFRHVVQMMFQSFRTSQTVATDIPNQVILPQAPTSDSVNPTL